MHPEAREAKRTYNLQVGTGWSQFSSEGQLRSKVGFSKHWIGFSIGMLYITAKTGGLF